jgi:hypothetical protein
MLRHLLASRASWQEGEWGMATLQEGKSNLLGEKRDREKSSRWTHNEGVLGDRNLRLFKA